jgi:hypothetical protein
MTKRIAEILSEDLGVKERYEHGPKRVTTGESIETNGRGVEAISARAGRSVSAG